MTSEGKRKKNTDKERLKDAVVKAAIVMASKAYMAGWEFKAEKVCRAVDCYLAAMRQKGRKL